MAKAQGANVKDLGATLERLHFITSVAEREAKKVLVQEALPFADDEAAMKSLERRMGKWMVEQRVWNDPEVQEAMGKSVAKKRASAPHGAKGTK